MDASLNVEGGIHAEGKQQHNGDNQPVDEHDADAALHLLFQTASPLLPPNSDFLLYHLHGSVATGIDNFRQIF